MSSDFTKKTATDFYWYHSVDLLDGRVTEGDYDIGPILHQYCLPDDMHGMDVLDVGRGSGAFAFEFERRGAKVIATDLASFLDWDFVGGEPERQRRASVIGDPQEFSEKHIYGAFEFAKWKRRSKVESKYVNVYDLRPELFGGKKFDVVFCGSITSHLRDPILAMERLFSVTKTKCIIASPCFGDDQTTMPLMCFVTGDPDRRSWWIFNRQALIDMLRSVGFTDVQIVSRFNLQLKRTGGSYEHLVAHAIV